MSENPDVALLSIRPRYADAIFEGRKRVEFRRKPIASTVRHVVVYSTLPQGRVVGVCRVVAQHRSTPGALWKRFSNCGEIDSESFFAYFEGAEIAYAIELDSPQTINPEDGMTLAALGASRPPQSFQYLREEGRGRAMAFAR